MSRPTLLNAMPPREPAPKGARTRIDRWAHPTLERLEDRHTPAGAVTAVLSSGTLTVLGIDDLSEGGILAGLNDQELTITGGMPGTFTIAGVGGTKINGKAVDTFIGVKNLRIDLRQGTDVVTVNTAILSGTLTFNGGAGDDMLTIGGIPGKQSLGAVTVNGGDDFDEVNIGQGIITIAGALSFNGGSGSSSVHLGILGTDELTMGSVNITNGDGADNVTVDGAKFSVGGGVTINNGQSALSNVALTADIVSIGGNLSITNLAGEDEIIIGDPLGSVTTRSVVIRNGDGNASITFAGKSHDVAGGVTIANGVGFDELTIGAMTISGNVNISHGTGGSTTAFKGATFATQGSLSLLCGEGADVLMVDNVNLTVHGALSVNSGLGTSSTLLTPTSHLTVDGVTTITGGSEFDTVSIGKPLTSIALRNLTINLGNGGGNVSIEGPGTVNGNLTINARDGYDKFASFAPLTVTGNTSLSFGSGPSSVRFVGIGTLLERSLTVTNLDGPDSFETGGLGFTVNGVTTFNNGDGSSLFDFASKDNKFNSPMTISSRAGIDTVNFTGTLTSKSMTINTGLGPANVSFLDDIAIQGNLNMTTGSGNDAVKFAAPVYIAGSVSLTTAAGNDSISWAAPGTTVLGNITIRTGDGEDLVTLHTLTVGGAANIDLGGLNDRLILNDSTFFGTVTITAGTGSDGILIEQLDTGTSTKFVRPVTIRLGDGADTLRIGLPLDLSDLAEFDAAVTFDGGPGLDLAELLPVIEGGTRSNVFAIFPTFLGMEAIT